MAAAETETDGETEADGAMSESDFEVASTIGHGPARAPSSSLATPSFGSRMH